MIIKYDKTLSLADLNIPGPREHDPKVLAFDFSGEGEIKILNTELASLEEIMTTLTAIENWIGKSLRGEKLRFKYRRAFSDDEFQEALFEYLLEAKPQKLDDIQAKRQQIKQETPNS